MTDNYNSLFNSNATFFQLVTQETTFGRLASTVPDVKKYKSLYIGVSSVNELYDEIKYQKDSYFEIKATLVPSGTVAGYQYAFDKS